MRRFTLTIFPDLRSALRGFYTLEDLHREGSVRLFAAAVAERDERGALRITKRTSAVPLGAGLGALIGSVRSELLEHFAVDLAPGQFAVVAELEERWVAPVDRWARAVGGRPVCAWWKDFGADAPETARRSRDGAGTAKREAATPIAALRQEIRHA